MKRLLRILGIFALQFVVLFILAHLAGNPIMSAFVRLTSMASCPFIVLDFRFLIGACIASIAMAGFLLWKDARSTTIWTFVAALALCDLIFATHMKIVGCS